MSGRRLGAVILAWCVLALLVYPSACSYSNVTKPKECTEVRVEGHRGHKRPHNDTIYVGGCPPEEE